MPGWTQLDSRDDVATDAPAVRELGEAGAARKELAVPRPQPRQRPAMPEEDEPQPVAAEPLRHVSPIDEQQLEQSPSSGAPDGERTGVEATNDAAPDVEDDDHADPEAHPDAV